MPSSSSALTAVVVSGGKQYRVAPGDRILVDRVKAEAGDEIGFDRVLLVADGDQVKVLPDELQGIAVKARVLQHQRGPKIDVLRFKSKKRVRVRRGHRAGLTALEVLTVGAPATRKKSEKKAEAKPEVKSEAKPAAKADARSESKTGKKAPEAKAEAEKDD